jgi:mRNA interferase HigB
LVQDRFALGVVEDGDVDDMPSHGTPERTIQGLRSLWVSDLVPMVGTRYSSDVHLISRKALRDFWEKHRDAELAVLEWAKDVESAVWCKPQDIKARYRSASFLSDDRVVFNIKGNTYRLIVAIKYAIPAQRGGAVFVRFVGTHAEYDRIDAEEI